MYSARCTLCSTSVMHANINAVTTAIEIHKNRTGHEMKLEVVQ